MRLKRSKDWFTYWQERKIDWNTQYLATWNHPHRFFITAILKQFNWMSLMELGCGAGANLANIVKNIPGRQVGGIDINADAIALASKTFTGGHFKVGSIEDIFMSDKSSDVILTDMTLIYVGPQKIKKILKDIGRVARSEVILCEAYSSSLLKRLKLWYSSGYFAHDYEKLLKNLGFYDITIMKIPPEVWDGEPQRSFGFIIKASVPKSL